MAQPIIKSNTLATSWNAPGEMPNSSYVMTEIPLTPPDARLFGNRNKLKAEATNTEPVNKYR